jgi:fumarate reductase flavoprotein subunit
MTKVTLENNLRADIVIVGGGGSGLAAAAASLEKGIKNIVILEKRAKLGGNSVFPGGLLAAGSRLQRRLGMDTTADEVFRKAMSYAHWRLNAPLVRALIDKSSDTIDWLEAKGVHFTSIVGQYPNHVPNTYHMAEGPGTTGSSIVKAFSRECRESGTVRIFCKTPAKHLLVHKNGRIAGVMTADKEGREIHISAKSVVVCTGGFIGNEEIIREYDPSFNKDQMRPHGIAHNGDGILMAREIGVALDGMVTWEWEHFSGSIALTVLARRPTTVWVNRKGKRFMDESVPVVGEVANAMYRQPGRVTYALFDENIKTSMLDQELTPAEALFMAVLSGRQARSAFRDRVEKDLAAAGIEGKVKISNSWDKIARFIGAEPEALKATIEEYNSFCDHGHDEMFVKDRLHLAPLGKPPYYALACGIGLMGTHGGIKINERMEALDKEDEPVPGLYAAGIETGTTDWDTYNINLPGHSFGFAINSGRIAGEEAARYVKGL